MISYYPPFTLTGFVSHRPVHDNIRIKTNIDMSVEKCYFQFPNQTGCTHNFTLNQSETTDMLYVMANLSTCSIGWMKRFGQFLSHLINAQFDKVPLEQL